MDEADAKGTSDGRKLSIANLVIEIPTARILSICCMASASSPQVSEVSLSLVQQAHFATKKEAGRERDGCDMNRLSVRAGHSPPSGQRRPHQAIQGSMKHGERVQWGPRVVAGLEEAQPLGGRRRGQGCDFGV